jgi:hypothetical protein
MTRGLSPYRFDPRWRKALDKFMRASPYTVDGLMTRLEAQEEMQDIETEYGEPPRTMPPHVRERDR